MPAANHVDFFVVIAKMVFKIMGIGAFAHGIDTPILPIVEQHSRPWGQRLHVNIFGHPLANVVFYSSPEPFVDKRFQHKVFETVLGNRLKESMVKTFGTIFLTRIDL